MKYTYDFIKIIIISIDIVYITSIMGTQIELIA